MMTTFIGMCRTTLSMFNLKKKKIKCLFYTTIHFVGIPAEAIFNVNEQQQ